jgi:hypothetical protein
MVLICRIKLILVARSQFIKQPRNKRSGVVLWHSTCWRLIYKLHETCSKGCQNEAKFIDLWKYWTYLDFNFWWVVKNILNKSYKSNDPSTLCTCNTIGRGCFRIWYVRPQWCLNGREMMASWCLDHTVETFRHRCTEGEDDTKCRMPQYSQMLLLWSLSLLLWDLIKCICILEICN